MAATFYIKQNDTAPSLEAALTDSNGRKRDMSQASAVRFHMKDENGNVLVDNAGLVINTTKGIIAYQWQAGDTANTGTHSAEFEVTYNNGQVETFPNTGYIKVIIKEDLA